MSTSESELIRRARTGDAEAFCLLAKNYERRVYALALHYCRHPEDAEDLSQEVWLKAFKSLGTYRAEASFYTWLRRITINAFLNRRRETTVACGGERAPVRFDSLSDAGEEGRATTPLILGESENGLYRQALVGRVMGALGELSPQQRLIFLLKHREGMTYQEIADACGCSVGAVKKTLFRAVLKLRAALGLSATAADCVALAAGD